MIMRRLRKDRPVLSVIAAAIVLLAASAVQATKLKSQNLTELISSSQSIIFGSVTSVTDGIDPDGTPYTEVTIAVSGSAKGDIAENSDYTFRQFGLLAPRMLDNGRQLVAVAPDGFARWRKGEAVVAFLYRPAGITGLQTTAGLAQGKLTRINDRLVNEFHNLGMFEGVEFDEGLLTPEEQNMILTPGAVDAEAFMGLVLRAATEDWIGNGRMR